MSGFLSQGVVQSFCASCQEKARQSVTGTSNTAGGQQRALSFWAVALKCVGRVVMSDPREAPTRAVREWSTSDACQWLVSCGLSCYTKSFQNNEVDGSLLCEIQSSFAAAENEKQMLQELGIKIIHKNKFCRLLKELDTTPRQVPGEAGASASGFGSAPPGFHKNAAYSYTSVPTAQQWQHAAPSASPYMTPLEALEQRVMDEAPERSQAPSPPGEAQPTTPQWQSPPSPPVSPPNAWEQCAMEEQPQAHASQRSQPSPPGAVQQATPQPPQWQHASPQSPPVPQPDAWEQRAMKADRQPQTPVSHHAVRPQPQPSPSPSQPQPQPVAQEQFLSLGPCAPGVNYGMRWCDYGEYCKEPQCLGDKSRAHSEKEAFCPACNTVGHVIGDHGPKFCLLCREEHHVKDCPLNSYTVRDKRQKQHERSKWYFGERCRNDYPHSSATCGYAHDTDNVYCSQCKMKGHTVDECANPTIWCKVCGIKGHHRKNKDVCEHPERFCMQPVEGYPFAKVWKKKNRR